MYFTRNSVNQTNLGVRRNINVCCVYIVCPMPIERLMDIHLQFYAFILIRSSFTPSYLRTYIYLFVYTIYLVKGRRFSSSIVYPKTINDIEKQFFVN